MTKDGTNSSNHQRFLTHLEESESAVLFVARWLQFRGHTVTLPAVSMAESHLDWKAHADSGDLFISQRVEVKQLSVCFTCAADWPFGEKFIVCARHAFDRAKPKPYAYVILSADREAIAFVKADTSGQWRVERRKDSRYDNVEQEFYLVPVSLVGFFKISKSQPNV